MGTRTQTSHLGAEDLLGAELGTNVRLDVRNHERGAASRPHPTAAVVGRKTRDETHQRGLTARLKHTPCHIGSPFNRG